MILRYHKVISLAMEFGRVTYFDTRDFELKTNVFNLK